jgi:hypothetical protein
MTDITARAGSGEITIEVGSGGYSEDTGLGDKLSAKAADALVRARETVFLVAEEFVGAADALEPEQRPSELTVQFGVNLTVAGTAKIASAQSSATFNVTLKYDLSANGKSKE